MLLGVQGWLDRSSDIQRCSVFLLCHPGQLVSNIRIAALPQSGYWSSSHCFCVLGKEKGRRREEQNSTFTELPQKPPPMASAH